MIDDLLQIAVRVGALVLSWRESGGREGYWEGAQFKAEADARAHDAWIVELDRCVPGLPVMSEEDNPPFGKDRPERYFLIDPIDGTASYAHGFAGFVTQIALMEAARPVLAVIHAPALGLTWHAKRGGGAFLNERRLQLRPAGSRLIVIDNYPEPLGIAKRLVHELPATGYLECGSIALKACRIADGTADLFVKDVTVRDWDVAPCDLLLAESGGWLTDARGQLISYEGPPEKLGLVAAVDEKTAARALAILNARQTV